MILNSNIWKVKLNSLNFMMIDIYSLTTLLIRPSNSNHTEKVLLIHSLYQLESHSPMLKSSYKKTLMLESCPTLIKMSQEKRCLGKKELELKREEMFSFPRLPWKTSFSLPIKLVQLLFENMLCLKNFLQSVDSVIKLRLPSNLS